MDITGNNDLQNSRKEWIIEFYKNRFNAPASKIKEALLKVGNSCSDIELYLKKALMK